MRLKEFNPGSTNDIMEVIFISQLVSFKKAPKKHIKEPTNQHTTRELFQMAQLSY